MSSQNTKGCLIVLGILVGMGVMGIGAVAFGVRQVAKAEEAEAQKISEKKKAEAARFAAMTPAEHLTQAAKFLEEGKLASSEKELKAVPVGTPGLSDLEARQANLVAKNRAADKAAKEAKLKLEKAAKEAKLKQDAKELKELRAKLKKQGVSIGMTQAEVLMSSWGKPESVNRTTGAYGVHEQWCYSGHHSYLYFEDGILTSIQN